MTVLFWLMLTFGAFGTLGMIRFSKVSSVRGYIYCGLFTAAFFSVGFPIIDRSLGLDFILNVVLGVSLGAALMTVFKIVTPRHKSKRRAR